METKIMEKPRTIEAVEREREREREREVFFTQHGTYLVNHTQVIL